MQRKLDVSRANDQLDAGTLAAMASHTEDFIIDPVTLANLDVGLFKALLNLGTSRERICSALCLSYAEFDYISTLIKGKR